MHNQTTIYTFTLPPRNNKIKTNQENTVAATCDLLDALKEIEEASKNTSPLYKWSRLRKDAIDNITDLFN